MAGASARSNDGHRSTVRRTAIVVVAVVLVLSLVRQLPPVRTVAITAALVPEMLGLVAASDADGPNVESVTYGAVADRMDIWLPADAEDGIRAPAVVLALGVHPQPIDHPDITRVARAIAGAGVVVGVPDSTALRELRVTPAEPAHLVDAFLVVAARPEVRADRVGLAGFSAGASMALVAAADPRIATAVRYVSSFGGYANAETLLVDVATRTTVLAGAITEWQPDPGIRRDVLELMLVAIEDDPGADALRRELPTIVAADSPPFGADVSVLAGLQGDPRSIYLLFTAADRAIAEESLNELSPRLRGHLAGISPLSVAARIEAPVFLLHGAADDAISVAHADALAQAVADVLVRYTRFGSFGHEQPGVRGLDLADIGDIWELSVYLRDIVAAATE